MKSRTWLRVGVLIGVGVAIGRVPYLAGAARSLADTAQRLVTSAGAHVVNSVAGTGAPQRAVLGLAALIALIVPGVTALLLVVAARTTARLRSAVALLLAALGAAAFFYQPKGSAAGALVLALAVGGLAVTLSGPLLVAPLAALAGLIGGEYLPRLLSSQRSRDVPVAVIKALHEALLSSAAAPDWLRVLALVVAVAPFAVAVRLVLSR